MVSKRSARVSSRPRRCCSSASKREAVLDDDHGAVDDDAEVDRAEAHQVGADPALHHAGDGEQHRQRDDAGGDERGADVAEHQEQHGDHQQRAFDQVLLDGLDGGLDQAGAVVDRSRATTPSGSDVAISSSFAATRCATARLFSPISSMAVPSTVSLPSSVAAPVRSVLALAHFGDVADADRHAAPRADDDVADFVDVRDLPRRADEVLFAVALDVAGADVGVIASPAPSSRRGS